MSRAMRRRSCTKGTRGYLSLNQLRRNVHACHSQWVKVLIIVFVDDERHYVYVIQVARLHIGVVWEARLELSHESYST